MYVCVYVCGLMVPSPFLRAANVFLVAATRENVNAAMVFQFLYALVDVFKAYFGGGFEEEVVRENFSLVYELLDEVMDFGYAQNCSADLLKTFIMQEGAKTEGMPYQVATSIAPQVPSLPSPPGLSISLGPVSGPGNLHACLAVFCASAG